MTFFDFMRVKNEMLLTDLFRNTVNTLPEKLRSFDGLLEVLGPGRGV